MKLNNQSLPTIKPISDYVLSLDIGTNSVGYSVTDLNGHIINHNGRALIGSTIFPQGKTKADTRLYRGQRRNSHRNKNRRHEADRQIFTKIAKRLNIPLTPFQLSGLTTKDQQKHGNKFQDPIRMHGYATIYHAMVDGINNHTKLDLNVIRTVVFNLLTNRGTFINPTPVDKFKNDNFNFSDVLKTINHNLSIIFGTHNLLNLANEQRIKSLIKSKAQSDYSKVKDLGSLISPNFKVGTAIAKAILGYKFQLNDIYNHPIKAKDDKAKWALDFSKDTADDDIEAITTGLSYEQSNTLTLLRKTNVYFVILKYVPEGKRLCEAKVMEYDKHHAQKKVFNQWLTEVQARDDKTNHVTNSSAAWQKYQQAVTTYQTAKKQAKQAGKKLDTTQYPKPKKPVNCENAKTLKYYYEAAAHIKKHLLKSGSDKRAKYQFVTYADFYAKIWDYLGKDDKPIASHLTSQSSRQIKDWTDAHDLLRRQRGIENINIPMQMKGQDLNAFLQSQSQFYPELLTTEKEHPHELTLNYLFRQRIPYWVGPLTTSEYQQTSGQNVYAWAIKKPEYQQETMNIYNFERIIDKEKTVENFINRLIGHDNNYLGEPVLPNSNLDIEQYKVYSELNQTTINGRKFKDYEKQAIYNGLFKKHPGSITIKQLNDFLKTHFKYNHVAINGLANSTKFNNQLATYHTMKRMLGDKVDDPKYHNDLNKITTWLTIYQDSNTIAHRLKTFPWLTQNEINQLKTISYTGWSHISEKLLNGIQDDNGDTLLTAMQKTTITLQSWLHLPDIAIQIDKHNAEYITNHPDTLANDLKTVSGEVKRSNHMATKVIYNVIHIMGGKAPRYLINESTRAATNQHFVPDSRLKALAKLCTKIQGHQALKSLLKSIISLHESNKTPVTYREFLYFSQLGKSLYTGKDLDYSQLSSYNLDHIIPQSVIKNDSIDNLALVEAEVNANKNNQTAREYCEKVYPASLTIWRNLNHLKLISPAKYKYLMMTQLDKYTKQGFINRQFNDTSTTIKWMNLICHTVLPNTKLIKINGVMDSQISKYYNWPKIRDYNDCHHGFNAYENALLALYVTERYPKLASFFEYGKIQFGVDLKHLTRVNLIAGLNPHVNTTQPIDIKYRNIFMTNGNYWYNNPKISVTRDSYDNSGQFHGQTHISAADAQKSKSEVIEAQPNHSVAQYGGYTHNEPAYSAIVKVSHHVKTGNKTEITFHLMPVTMVMAKQYNKLSNQKIDEQLVRRYTQLHHKYINDTVTVVKRHVRLQQLIQTNGQLVYLSTGNRMQPAHQLHLPTADIKLISQKVPTDTVELAQYSQALDKVLDDLITELTTHYQLFDNNIQRIISHRKAFTKLSVNDKIIPGKTKSTTKVISGKLSVIKLIMQACHNNGQQVKIPVFDIKAQFGNMQKANITFNVGDKLIYRDITGVYGNTFSLTD